MESIACSKIHEVSAVATSKDSQFQFKIVKESAETWNFDTETSVRIHMYLKLVNLSIE